MRWLRGWRGGPYGRRHMGTKFEFVCQQCGHSAEVSGGRDVGMVAVVQTMVCQDCKELVDVLIGKQGREGPTGDPDYDRNLGRCPRCEGVGLITWDDSRPCPRCDSEMIKGGTIALWD